MSAVLSIVAPVFALIFVGWAARSLGVLSPQATRELNKFVVYLSLPALLFDIASHARPSEIWQPRFIGAYGLGCLSVFICGAGLAYRRSRSIADAGILGLDAGYANTGYLGFPLAYAAFGPDASAPTMIATIMTVCVLFAIGIAMVEIERQGEGSRVALIWKVVASVIRNPLVFAPILGALVPLFRASIPASVETFLKLLGGAASPCALVALGLFLAEQGPSEKRNRLASLSAVALKLIGQPILTWILCRYVFDLPLTLTHIAVLIAALPTGTGPFMLAEFYGREASITAKVILASTILSLGSVSLYLYAIR